MPLYRLSARQHLTVQVGARYVSLTANSAPDKTFELDDQQRRKLEGAGVICTLVPELKPEPKASKQKPDTDKAAQ